MKAPLRRSLPWLALFALLLAVGAGFFFLHPSHEAAPLAPAVAKAEGRPLQSPASKPDPALSEAPAHATAAGLREGAQTPASERGAFAPAAAKPRPIAQLGDPLMALTALVSSDLALSEEARQLSGDALLAHSTVPRPDLQKAFQGYKVLERHAGHKVVLLVCDAALTRALLEDASWTYGTLDRRWHDTAPAAKPEFTLPLP